MPLTDIAVRNAKPADNAKKLFDSGGLYLEVAPSGGKWWRLKYRFDGKEKRLSLGVYPDVSLKDARDRRDEARKLLANEIDPSENRKAKKAAKVDRAANSFEAVAREWFAKHSTHWSENHSNRTIHRLERDIFPWIGGLPIATVTAPQLLDAVRRIENRGALETAHRALGNCGQVLRYAVATERDPSGDLRGALPPVKGEHFASVTEPKKVAEVFRALDDYEGAFTVRCALRLAPRSLPVRVNCVMPNKQDIDLDATEWRYIVTKTKTQHIVPLSSQAIEILQEFQPLTGRGRHVFPSARNPKGDRPMSDNAVLSAMRRMGIDKEEMSGHGFRAMARTILDEVLGFRSDYIEHQLARAVRGPNGRAYNRTAHLPERKKMMQEWADYLDKLKAGAEIIAIDQSA